MERKGNSKGKFIVFEGLDGSGKSSQAKLLVNWLEKAGHKTAKIDFPRHGEKAAALVDEYLRGKYGKPEEVNPYCASIFYACDRYDASFELKKWLEQRKIVIGDRYIASNIGHQGGKLKTGKEWKEYVDWLFNLEYGIFGIPKPDVSIILKTNAEFSQKLSAKISDIEKEEKRRVYLGNEKHDIHEKDKLHLENALNSFLRLAEVFPQEFKVIECIENGKLLSLEIIHQKVLEIVKKLL